MLTVRQLLPSQSVHIPTDHPSCSKQHAVIQFRQKTNETLDGEFEVTIKCALAALQLLLHANCSCACRPYIIDLESTNGTFLNGKQIDAAKYYELLEKVITALDLHVHLCFRVKQDVLKFGFSTREYVLLHADMAD